MNETEFTEFCRHKQIKPVKRIQKREGDIFIAETDLIDDNKLEFPNGYYQTSWFIAGKNSKGKMDIGQWINFDVMHDFGKGWTTETKRLARINAAIKVAENYLKLSHEACNA